MMSVLHGPWTDMATGARAAIWAGRHSLLVYLVHQPVLIAITWTLAKTLGALP